MRIPKRNFDMETTRNQTASKLNFLRSVIIGTSQTFALLAGISRSGVTMVSGIYSGLDYEDAARFSFLLATPIIFAAGIYKLPDLFGNLSHGIHGQLIVGGLSASIAAYFSVRFLDKYFRNRTLKPFGIYCLVVGSLMLVVSLFGIRHF
jgi:undecaprenyl-diphosphatase